MLAEKIQTIYSKGFLNSRSKDYYDLYIIYKLKDRDIDPKTLERACERTFLYRNTELDRNKIMELMQSLKTDTAFLKRWEAYSKKNVFARDIDFEEVLDNGMKIIEKIGETN